MKHIDYNANESAAFISQHTEQNIHAKINQLCKMQIKHEYYGVGQT